VPVTPALCFVDAEWRLFAKPFQHDSVWITWPKSLVALIDRDGEIPRSQVTRIGERLARALPSATSS
jgi:hypothetical protein